MNAIYQLCHTLRNSLCQKKYYKLRKELSRQHIPVFPFECACSHIGDEKCSSCHRWLPKLSSQNSNITSTYTIAYSFLAADVLSSYKSKVRYSRNDILSRPLHADYSHGNKYLKILIPSILNKVSGTQFFVMTNIIQSLSGNPLNTSEYVRQLFSLSIVRLLASHLEQPQFFLQYSAMQD